MNDFSFSIKKSLFLFSKFNKFSSLSHTRHIELISGSIWSSFLIFYIQAVFDRGLTFNGVEWNCQHENKNMIAFPKAPTSKHRNHKKKHKNPTTKRQKKKKFVCRKIIIFE